MARNFTNVSLVLVLVLASCGRADRASTLLPPPPTFDPVRRELAEITGPCERHIARAGDARTRRQRVRRIVERIVGILLSSTLTSVQSQFFPDTVAAQPVGGDCSGAEPRPSCALTGNQPRLDIYDGLYGDTDRAEVAHETDYEALLERIDDILWETPRVDEWSDEQRAEYGRLRNALREACERIERDDHDAPTEDAPWLEFEQAPTDASPEAP